ncbi:MAG: hypothetical protein RRB13_06560 [bacterium]|nr:hypothetical protein [bacterium]
MARKVPEIWIWIAALALALVIHLATLPGVSQWISKAFLAQPRSAPITLDLTQALPPQVQPKPPQRKSPSKFEPLPEEEKVLTDAPDHIDPKAMSSGPKAGGAQDQGTKKAQRKGEGAAEAEKFFKNNGPLSTGEGGLNYAINNYQWSYERFMKNWAVALSQRWLAPADYLKGLVPEGGYVWVKVILSKDGGVQSFEVIEHNVTDDMAAMVVYAINGVRTRPPLPENFPEEKLVAYWRFIYPPFEQLKAMLEAQRQGGS